MGLEDGQQKLPSVRMTCLVSRSRAGAKTLKRRNRASVTKHSSRRQQRRKVKRGDCFAAPLRRCHSTVAGRRARRYRLLFRYISVCEPRVTVFASVCVCVCVCVIRSRRWHDRQQGAWEAAAAAPVTQVLRLGESPHRHFSADEISFSAMRFTNACQVSYAFMLFTHTTFIHQKPVQKCYRLNKTGSR